MIDQSVASRSSQSSAANAKNRLLNPTGTQLYLFTLLDQISQHVKLPTLLYMPFLVMFALQMVSISMWVNHSNVWKEGDQMHFFLQIPNLQPLSTIDNYELIVFVVYFVICLLVIFFQLGILYVNKVFRRFPIWMLYIIRFLVELVCLIILIPIMNFIGFLLKQIFSGKADTENITFLIFTVIGVLFIYHQIYTLYILINASAYLGISPLVAFDIKPLLRLALLQPLFKILDIVSGFFPEWTHHLLLVIHLLFICDMIYLSFQRPFIAAYMNVTFSFVLFLILFYDIIGLVTIPFKSIDPMIIMIVMIVLIPVAFGIVFTIYTVTNKKIKRSLKFSTDEEITDEKRTERLMELQLELNENKAILYWNYILTHQVELYLDFLYIKFLIQYHHSFKVLILALKYVSYFPPEFRSLNMMISNMYTITKLPQSAEFLLYQIHKINVLRQSSSSAEITEKFHQLIPSSKEVSMHLNSFWSKTSYSNNDFVALYNDYEILRNRWEEMLVDFPNTPEYYRLYVAYLLDCCSDFKEGIRNFYKADLMEGGKSFSNDLSFIYFAKNFPLFIKKKLIDLKGNFIKKGFNNNNGKQSSSNRTNTSSTNSSFSDIDAAVEENLGKQLMANAKLRLALQAVTTNRSPRIAPLYSVYTFFLVLLGVAVGVFIFTFFNGYFAQRSIVSERAEYLNCVRFNYYSAILNVVFEYGTRLGTIDISHAMKPIRQFETGDDSVFPVGRDWIEGAIIFNVDARANYTLLMSELAKVATTEDIYETAYYAFAEEVPLTYCVYGEPAPELKVNYKTTLAQNLISLSMLTTDHDFVNWFNHSQQMCSLLKTASEIGPYYDALSNSLMTGAKHDVSKSDGEIYIIMIVAPIAYAVLSLLVPWPIYYLYKKELQRFSQLLLTMDNSIKKEAMKPVGKITDMFDDENNDIQYDQVKGTNKLFVWIFLCDIMCILLTVIILLHVIQARTANTNVNSAVTWLTLARIRKTYAMEACTWGHLLVLFGVDLGSHFINLDIITNKTKEALVMLQKATRDFQDGNGEVPPVMGNDDVIDYYEMSDQCQINESRVSFHEYYRCGSMSHLVAFLNDMVNDIIVKNDQFQGKMLDVLPTHLLEIVTDHLTVLGIRVDKTVLTVFTRFMNDFDTDNIIFFTFEIILSLIIYVIMSRIKIIYNQAYQAIIVLLRRVSPFALVQNQNLMNYLLNRNSTLITIKSTGQSVFNASPDAIICTSITGMIEIINPAVTSILGYTPDQLLGQMFEEIIDPSDQEKIKSQISMMEQGQASLVYEDHVSCVSDTSLKVQCSLTLIGMSNDGKTIRSFTAILRDETELLTQQEEAEQAKKKSEMLLYQILPRDIVSRLNQGEKDISFVVPSSTIMFIDIVKFSEYSSTLTPTEIMEQLSSVFEIYDEHLKKYSLLTKIKLIGDVYMCAGGLFSHDEPPTSHAQQMVRFGLDCLVSLDEFNLHKNTLLSVRVGVNTGGPLIAGVLGTDKPTFDIIGDPINIASRLQSTGIPGQIQVSQDTHDLIADMDIDIQCRGEIMLKGKGKSMAYTITPRRGTFAIGTASDELLN